MWHYFKLRPVVQEKVPFKEITILALAAILFAGAEQ